MIYKLIVSEAAENDIYLAMLWYETQREGLSIDFELCLDAAFNYLERNPHLFQKKYQETRVVFLEKFPYGIHYFVFRDTVKIIGVFNTRQNPEAWKRE